MSLINEALKRAEAEKRSNSAEPPDAFDFETATTGIPAANGGRRTGWRSIIILGVCVTLAALAVTYIWPPPARSMPMPAEAQATPTVSPITAAGASRGNDNSPTDLSSAPEPTVLPAGDDDEGDGAAETGNPAAFSPEQFKLGGVMESSAGSRAIVNNHLVAVGDEVDGAKVVIIRKYAVVLEKDGKRISLRL